MPGVAHQPHAIQRPGGGPRGRDLEPPGAPGDPVSPPPPAAGLGVALPKVATRCQC